MLMRPTPKKMTPIGRPNISGGFSSITVMYVGLMRKSSAARPTGSRVIT